MVGPTRMNTLDMGGREGEAILPGAGGGRDRGGGKGVAGWGGGAMSGGGQGRAGVRGRPRQSTASRDRCARLFTVEACLPQRTPAR